MQAQCFVHSAPMTRTSFSLYRSPPGTVSPLQEMQTPRSPNDTRQITAVLEHGDSGAPFLAAETSVKEAHISQIAAVILQVHANYEFIKHALVGYHSMALASLVPGAITLGFTFSLPDLFLSAGIDGTPGSQSRARAFAKAVLHSTTLGFVPNSSTTADEFIAAWSGRNIRLQSIGLICTIAARSMLFGVAGDDEDHEGFIRVMLQSSSSCLSVARDIAPIVDDVFLWLEYENLHLSKAVRGDWRKNIPPQ